MRLVHFRMLANGKDVVVNAEKVRFLMDNPGSKEGTIVVFGDEQRIVIEGSIMATVGKLTQ